MLLHVIFRDKKCVFISNYQGFTVFLHRRVLRHQGLPLRSSVKRRDAAGGFGGRSQQLGGEPPASAGAGARLLVYRGEPGQVHGTRNWKPCTPADEQFRGG